MYKTYQIVCSSCKGQRKIKVFTDVNGEWIDWLEDKQDKPFTIISGRKRFDGQWGWECTCGAKDILTEQEDRVMTNPAAPTPTEISEIKSNLVINKPKFAMREL